MFIKILINNNYQDISEKKSIDILPIGLIKKFFYFFFKFPSIPPNIPVVDVLYIPPPPLIPMFMVAKAIRFFSIGTDPGPGLNKT